MGFNIRIESNKGASIVPECNLSRWIGKFVFRINNMFRYLIVIDSLNKGTTSPTTLAPTRTLSLI